MDDQRVYVPLQSEELTALDRQTGQVLWVRGIESEWPPVVHDGVVYLAASDELHALDAATGTSIWRVPLPGTLAVPLVFDTGWLFAVSEPGEVVAFRAADGQRLWNRSLGAAPRSPAVAGEDDAIYFTLANGRVVSLNLPDGSTRWEQQLPGMLSEPSWAEERVFVGSTDNFFYALRADTGALAWKWRAGGDVIGASTERRPGVHHVARQHHPRGQPRKRQPALEEGHGFTAGAAAARVQRRRRRDRDLEYAHGVRGAQRSAGRHLPRAR